MRVHPAEHARRLGQISILRSVHCRPHSPACSESPARHFFSACTLGLFLLVVSAVSATGTSLIEITEQDIRHDKDVSISVYAQSTTLAGSNTIYTAGPGAPSFTNAWTESADYAGVTVNGNSSLDYAFNNHTFNFSVAANTSHSGTSAQSITGIPRAAGYLNLTFTLNQAAMVYFNLTGLVENDGNGGSGGDPIADGSLQMLTGYFQFFGDSYPLYADVFPSQFVFDSSVGNGSEMFAYSSSALLEPGIYRLSSSAKTQIAYQQPISPNVGISAQSASVNLTARFEAVPETGSAMLLVVSFASLLLRRRLLPIYSPPKVRK